MKARLFVFLLIFSFSSTLLLGQATVDFAMVNYHTWEYKSVKYEMVIFYNNFIPEDQNLEVSYAPVTMRVKFKNNSNDISIVEVNADATMKMTKTYDGLYLYLVKINNTSGLRFLQAAKNETYPTFNFEIYIDANGNFKRGSVGTAYDFNNGSTSKVTDIVLKSIEDELTLFGKFYENNKTNLYNEFILRTAPLEKFIDKKTNDILEVVLAVKKSTWDKLKGSLVNKDNSDDDLKLNIYRTTLKPSEGVDVLMYEWLEDKVISSMSSIDIGRRSEPNNRLIFDALYEKIKDSDKTYKRIYDTKANAEYAAIFKDSQRRIEIEYTTGNIEAISINLDVKNKLEVGVAFKKFK